MKPRFTGLPFFVYPVNDMARARGFYGGVLGLTETANWENQWIEYDIGSGTLAICGFLGDAQPGCAGAAALEAEDFDATVAQLKAQGVRFVLEPVKTAVCCFARFLDSEGNHLVLHRRHEASVP